MTRTTLVTGGAGFLGSHLVDRLLAEGRAVVALDDLSTGRRENLEAAAASARFRLAVGDVRDRPLVDRLVAEADEVLHLAAVVGIRRVVADPVRTMETNVGGTAAVLAACARRGTPVLVASSSEVYGKGARPPFREEDDLVLGPTSGTRWGYAASKLAGEHLALAWRRERGLPVRVVRFFNTVGPRQVGDHGMVLPRFAEQALAGGPITVHGDGRQTRAFCHVADAVDAVLRLCAAPGAAGRVVNVGGEEEVGIRDLAERVRDAAAAYAGPGSAPPEVVHVAHAEVYGPGFEDPRRRVPDLSLLRELTGTVPGRPLSRIVRDAVAWAAQARAPAA